MVKKLDANKIYEIAESGNTGPDSFRASARKESEEVGGEQWRRTDKYLALEWIGEGRGEGGFCPNRCPLSPVLELTMQWCRQHLNTKRGFLITAKTSSARLHSFLPQNGCKFGVTVKSSC